MDFGGDVLAYLLGVALIAVRVGTLFMAFPFYSMASIPPQVKIFATMVLSASLFGRVGQYLPEWSTSFDTDTVTVLLYVLRELFIGLGMGLIARSFLWSCLASAEWVGTQMGFTVSSLFNPNTNTNEGPWGAFHSMAAIMLFISVGGHIFCLQALVDSYGYTYAAFESGAVLETKFASFWIEVGTAFFFWMLKLSGPMVVVILLMQMAMGVLSKFVPQINLWTVSIPATLGAGILIFSFMSPMYGDVLGTLFGESREYLYMWVKAVGGSS